MIYFRCKCGKREAWSSGLDPKPCQGCHECGTTLETSKSRHEPVQPHTFGPWELEMRGTQQYRVRRCKTCYHTEKEPFDTPLPDDFAAKLQA